MMNDDWLRGLHLLTGGTVVAVARQMDCSVRNVLRLQHEGRITDKRAAQMVSLVQELRRGCDEWLLENQSPPPNCTLAPSSGMQRDAHVTQPSE